MSTPRTRARSRAIRIGISFLTCAVLVTGTTESSVSLPVTNTVASLETPQSDSQATESSLGSSDLSSVLSDILKPDSSEGKQPPAITKLIPKLKEPADGKTCVGPEFATLGAIFSAIFDSFTPLIPPAQRGPVLDARSRVLGDLHELQISSLAVTNSPGGLGASKDAPMNKYRDPLSQWVVTQLMNVKAGTAAQPIRADNLTVMQAVESAWLYFYLTAVVPLTLVKSMLPADYSLGPVSVGTLLTLPMTIGAAGMKLFYKAMSVTLISNCLARMTPDEKARAGKPDHDLSFDAQVPEILTKVAGELAIAEPGSCPSIADMTLSQLVGRTSSFLQKQVSDPEDAKQIELLTKGLQLFMKYAPVPANLIPADPVDDDTVEELMDRGLGVAAAPEVTVETIRASLTDDETKRASLAEMTPLGELTVTKTLTAAFYAYSLTTLLVGHLNDAAAAALAIEMGGVDLMPRISGLYDAPKTYGLVVFHNTLRSVCFTPDGSGAPATSPAPSTSVAPTTSATPGSSTTPKPSTSTTPRSSTAPSTSTTPKPSSSTSSSPAPSSSTAPAPTPSSTLDSGTEIGSSGGTVTAG
ncbi:MAG: hypothetical protein WBG47_05770 [Gordonia sp. (in: high G+C Gram-positive bacteria)]|uniref:hypothetical protein n=1 Tax=Gordonia sp. (in: high G+C Gram-positive bacteria) TaxID=84139 RepID=UPI003C7835A8